MEQKSSKQLAKTCCPETIKRCNCLMIASSNSGLWKCSISVHCCSLLEPFTQCTHSSFLYQDGFLVPISGKFDSTICLNHLLTPVGKLVNARPGCANKSDMHHSKKSKSFMCGTAPLHTSPLTTLISKIQRDWALTSY